MKNHGWGLVLLLFAVGLLLVSCASDKPASDAPETDVSDSAAVTDPGGVSTPEETPSVPAEEGVPSAADEPAAAVEDTAAVAPERMVPATGSPETPAVAPETPLTEDVAAILPPEAIFADASSALDDLETYRYTTSFTFVLEGGEQAESGSIEMTAAIVQPDSKHLTWRDLVDGTQFEILQIGNRAWILEDGEWQEVPVVVAEAMSQAVLTFAPSVVWGGLFGGLDTQATYVGADTVNGIPAHHYTSTYQQWPGYWVGELENATGDVWIAEAGYPVKYHFFATGVDPEGEQGVVTWTMEISDVNGEISIEPPL